MEGLKALGGGAGGGRILQIHRRYACKEVNGHNNHWNSWYRRIVGLETKVTGNRLEIMGI